MNKSELYNDYCEKIEYDEVDGGIGYKGFVDRLSKIRTILKFVMNDSLFKDNSCTEEKKFFKNVINPILREDKAISKESRDFLFPLIKYSENEIFKCLKKEYCTDKYLKEISCISPDKKEYLLISLNNAYRYENRKDNMIVIYKIEQIHKLEEEQFYKKYIIDDNILIKFIEYVNLTIMIRDESFNNKITDNKYEFFNDEIIDNQYEVDINLSYKMTLVVYYRLCTCIENKRDEIMRLFFRLLNDKKKLEYKDKIFKILRNEIERMVYNTEEMDLNDRYESEEISEVIRFHKKRNSPIYKYIKPRSS